MEPDAIGRQCEVSSKGCHLWLIKRGFSLIIRVRQRGARQGAHPRNSSLPRGAEGEIQSWNDSSISGQAVFEPSQGGLPSRMGNRFSRGSCDRELVGPGMMLSPGFRDGIG